MTRASRAFDFDQYDELLRDPRNAAAYLAEFLESGDMELFQEGLRHVAKTGNPQMATVNKMLSALGLKLTVTAA